MMDKLGGMLTGGLLGNQIVGRFFNILVEDITPPSPPPVDNWTGGISASNAIPPSVTEKPRIIKFTITYKNQSYVTTHTINAGVVRLTINTISKLSSNTRTLKDIVVRLINQRKVSVKVSKKE